MIYYWLKMTSSGGFFFKPFHWEKEATKHYENTLLKKKLY